MPNLVAGPYWPNTSKLTQPPSAVDARELAERSYMFTRPFVLDSSRSEALLDLAPTPLDIAAKETVAWWQSQTNG